MVIFSYCNICKSKDKKLTKFVWNFPEKYQKYIGAVWIGEMMPFLVRIERISSKQYFQPAIQNQNDSAF